LILKAVSLGPQHGYGVLLRIEQISGTALVIEQGALYPALYRLEHRGLLKSEWGVSDNSRRAKFYELTASGRKRLKLETESWNRLVAGRARGAGAPPGGGLWWAGFRSFLSALSRRSGFEDAMSEEMLFHTDARAAALVRRGIPPAEANRQARIEFGAPGRYQ